MKKSITIRIPEPCHEDWNKMTETEKGKFCKVCTKEVLDFTKITDEELVKKVYKKENICGRFKASQLNREMKLERKSGFSLAPLAASFLLPFTLLASTKMGSGTKDSKVEQNFTSLNIGSLSNNSTRIQVITIGKITDENGKSIFNVEISSNESSKNELSGLKGDYKIVSLNDETLTFKKEGYITQEIKVYRKSSTIDITLKREENTIKTLEESAPMVKGKIASPEVIEKKTARISEKKIDTSKITIKGTVTDQSGFSLPGVNIVIKGTSVGTQTDFDGIYEIEVEKKQILIFSYIGFKTEELTLSNIDNYINLQMKMEEFDQILGGVIGVIITSTVADDSNRILGFKNHSTYDPEPAPWRKKVQKALDNEKEYSRIKRARKKEARRVKKNKK